MTESHEIPEMEMDMVNLGHPAIVQYVIKRKWALAIVFKYMQLKRFVKWLTKKVGRK